MPNQHVIDKEKDKKLTYKPRACDIGSGMFFSVGASGRPRYGEGCCERKGYPRCTPIVCWFAFREGWQVAPCAFPGQHDCLAFRYQTINTFLKLATISLKLGLIQLSWYGIACGLSLIVVMLLLTNLTYYQSLCRLRLGLARYVAMPTWAITPASHKYS